MINLYKDRNYKPYLVFPAILFVVFLFAIFIYPGITPGIDLRGGTEIRASPYEPTEYILEKRFVGGFISVRTVVLKF